MNVKVLEGIDRIIMLMLQHAAKARERLPIYLFGAGRLGRAASNVVTAMVPRTAIKGFLDNSPDMTGKTVDGFPVFVPDTPKRLGEKPYVVITSSIHENDIRRQCRELGYSDVVTLREFMFGNTIAERIKACLAAQENRERVPNEYIDKNARKGNDPALRILFLEENAVHKAVTEEYLAQFFYLAGSGALDELVEKQIVPATSVTNLFGDAYQIIFKQEKVAVPPAYTWTYSMLHDAGLCYLRLQTILGKYGYASFDSNASNFALAGGQAYFLDLGAIYLKPENTQPEFLHWMEVFICPLAAWLVGDYHLFHQLLCPYPSETLHAWHGFNQTVTWKLLAARFSDGLDSKRKKLFAVAAEEKRLVAIDEFNVLFPPPAQDMEWDAGAAPQAPLTPEAAAPYDNTLQIIRHYAGNATCATDLGGGEGWFAQRLLTELNLDRAVCLDYDAIAVDKGYRRIRGKNIQLTLSVWNVLTRFPLEYMIGDIVTIMNCLPNMVAAYGKQIDRILSRMAQYCGGHIFLELNLNDLREAEMPWHGVEAFTNHFNRVFELLHRGEIGDNRMLFAGKIR